MLLKEYASRQHLAAHTHRQLSECRGVYRENVNFQVRNHVKLRPLHQIVSPFERLRFPSGANLGPASFRERYCRALFILSNYIPAL